MWQCPECKETIRYEAEKCWNCGTSLDLEKLERLSDENSESEPYPDAPSGKRRRSQIRQADNVENKPGIFEQAILDLIGFPMIALNPERREHLARRGTLTATLFLIITYQVFWFVLFFIVAGSDPYIPLVDYLFDGMGFIVFFSLTTAGFLLNTGIHFACFRWLGGKGNINEHAYVTALYVVWFSLLYLGVTLVSALFSTAFLLGWDTPWLLVIIVGFVAVYLYLAVLSSTHDLDDNALFTGFALTILISVPICLLFIWTIGFLREAQAVYQILVLLMSCLTIYGIVYLMNRQENQVK